MWFVYGLLIADGILWLVLCLLPIVLRAGRRVLENYIIGLQYPDRKRDTTFGTQRARISIAIVEDDTPQEQNINETREALQQVEYADIAFQRIGKAWYIAITLICGTVALVIVGLSRL